MKIAAVLGVLLSLGLGAAPENSAASELSPEGLEWHRVSEDNLFMNAVAYFKGSQSHPIALLVLINSGTFTTGIGETQMRSDYSIRQVNFDCTAPGRYKVWKNWSYLVGQEQPVKMHALTDTWDVATSFHGPLDQWNLMCGRTPGTDRLPARASFDEMTADYRVRQTQKKARDEADKKEAQRRADEREAQEHAELAKSQMSPEIAVSRALGPDNHHWHYVFATPDYLGTIDVHRVLPGPAANLKRVSTALFVANSSSKTAFDQDYQVKFEEFDCDTPGRFRTLAGASYQRGGKLLGAFQDPARKWNTYNTENPMSRYWEWACKGDQKVKALQANQSFDDTLKAYREQVGQTQ